MWGELPSGGRASYLLITEAAAQPPSCERCSASPLNKWSVNMIKCQTKEAASWSVSRSKVEPKYHIVGSFPKVLASYASPLLTCPKLLLQCLNAYRDGELNTSKHQPVLS